MNLTEKNRVLSFAKEIDNVNLYKYVSNSNYARIGRAAKAEENYH